MRKIIKGFPTYEIDSDGFVVNTKTGVIKTKRIVRGYYYVDLYNGVNRKNLRLGRLVAQSFVRNIKGYPQVNHIDGNCLNDNVNNLEWVTYSENQYHKNRFRKSMGTYKSPKGNLKIKRKKVDKIFELRKKGFLHKEIAKKLKIGTSTVTHILLGSRRNNQ